MHIFTGVLVNNVFRFDVYCFAVSHKSWPDAGPVGMIYFFLGWVGADCIDDYSKTQS